MSIPLEKASTLVAAGDVRNRDWYIDKLFHSFMFICGISAVIFVLGIFVFVFKEGSGFIIHQLDWAEFFLSPKWRPTSAIQASYGTLAMVAGTAAVTLISMAVALPFSFGAAIFIAEFARGKTREWLKVVIELLAAIPSVVWGFIGLMIMNPLIIDIFDVPIGLNVLNSGIILGLMAAPIITSIAEDAFKAVPDTYREAAEALGATKWQVIYKVVLPAAKNGLLSAALLGVGRAFGETMAVLMASGHALTIPGSVFDSIRALTATIAAELGETPVGSDHYQALFAIGIFLFSITFIINMTADLIVRGIKNQ
ncbi:phosphate ABC transporter permease subunit PstC [Candidatus Magnetaquicoccus inordinatus]|uniref:phosphate ABC transporter permease subunit PstC n=1 Tax=Candidatus Magnetaquicoccus inordinatus TaxID=2496818 RepID=UPI00102CDBF9|nr:phosphate ABC transporter permease subunit PstC [Candidatus Magnetaquicoccus inordinatus]